MKKFIIATIAAMLALVSCEKDTADAIIGTWEATTVEMTVEGVNISLDIKEFGIGMSCVFKANGKGSMTETTKEESHTEEFSYSVDKDMLLIEVDGEEEELSIPISIDGKSMTLTFDGEMFDEESTKVKVHFIKK